MRRYLVVANQTLGGAALQKAISDRATTSEPSEFWVVVPATALSDLAVGAPSGLTGAPTMSRATSASGIEDDGAELAQKRLDQELDRLRSSGVQADGEIGDPDPIQAIRDALKNGTFDEIILATLPQGISRWLGQDLPHRVKRKFGLPLTHVVSA